MPQILIGNTGSGIFHKNDSMPGILYPIPQKNIPLCSKLLGVINQIIHNLLQTHGVGNDIFACPSGKSVRNSPLAACSASESRRPAA